MSSVLPPFTSAHFLFFFPFFLGGGGRGGHKQDGISGLGKAHNCRPVTVMFPCCCLRNSCLRKSARVGDRGHGLDPSAWGPCLWKLNWNLKPTGITSPTDANGTFVCWYDCF